MTQYLFTNQYQRESHDLYVEPGWCAGLLFDRVRFNGTIHDPACGTWTIPSVARIRGYKSTGADIVDRGYHVGLNFESEEIDFFKDLKWRDNIVSNPPYNLAERFADHAIGITFGKVALLVRLAFLEGQKRGKELFTVHRPSLVLVFSSRPSIGPLGAPHSGGKTAYCWIIWDKQNPFSGHTELDWIG